MEQQSQREMLALHLPVRSRVWAAKFLALADAALRARRLTELRAMLRPGAARGRLPERELPAWASSSVRALLARQQLRRPRGPRSACELIPRARRRSSSSVSSFP